MKYKISDKLKKVLGTLRKKDSETYKALNNKIREVTNSPDPNHYKPLKYGLKNLKRVHIRKSFVLVFKYNKDEEFIKFLDYEHHDRVYGKKYK